MSENQSSNNNQASSGGPNSKPDKSPVSAKKVAADQNNCQKSTGPQTAGGKAKAAANSYKHGFFAKKLFLTPEQAAIDQADYLAVANGIHGHYQPVGYLENLWVEKIATEALRAARLLAHEQRIFGWRDAFESRASSNLLRYQASVNRQLAQDIEELERIQAVRISSASSSDLCGGEECKPVEFEQPSWPPTAADGEAAEDSSTAAADSLGGKERPENTE